MNVATLKGLIAGLPDAAHIFLVVEVRSNAGKAKTIAVVEVTGASTADGELRLYSEEIEIASDTIR